MKVTITYFPKDEAMLATLIDQTIGRILDRAKRFEDETDGGEFRRIVFITVPPSRNGRKAIYRTKNAIEEKKQKKDHEAARNRRTKPRRSREGSAN